MRDRSADVQAVARGIGLDRRIGPKFLHAGPASAARAFRRTRARRRTSRGSSGEDFEIVEAVIRVNERQRERMVEKIVAASRRGSPRQDRRRCLGLSFKPETDDVRDAPAVEIAAGLLQERGVRVRAYDPQAMDAAGEQGAAGGHLCKDAYEACRDADALVIVTEWNQFRMLDLERVKELLRRPVVVDLRNIYDPGPMRPPASTTSASVVEAGGAVDGSH